MGKTNFDEVGKALKMYHEYLKANGQLEDDIITTCPKSPTGEHKWKHDDAYYSDFCEYCGTAKFHEQLNVLAGNYTNKKEKLLEKLSDSLETIKTTFEQLSKENDLGLFCPVCGDFWTATPQMVGEICETCGKGILRSKWRRKVK